MSRLSYQNLMVIEVHVTNSEADKRTRIKCQFTKRHTSKSHIQGATLLFPIPFITTPLAALHTNERQRDHHRRTHSNR